MFELLLQSVREKISVSNEEFDFCKTLFIPKKLRKRQYLLQEGDICRYTAFVEKGMLRTFTVDEKGNEPILQFSMEGWWIADLYSFLTEEPSPYNIEALEDCELLLINKENWEILLAKVPAFERYFRILIQNNLIATQRRLMSSLSESAEEKYTKLIHNFPGCIQRVPQHMIASYLGITPETLSRIRGQMAARSKG
ncbi:MAG TPA: Crp/Fnr family transcriptional regulator [Hanamia sp.]|jgi:CRP-like cAMP-binding protein|nr:Crp/Fnr family transcriptional regulator [Hanamia sp.]